MVSALPCWLCIALTHACASEDLTCFDTAQMYSNLSTLHAQYEWFRFSQDQTGRRQLIAPVHTYMGLLCWSSIRASCMNEMGVLG